MDRQDTIQNLPPEPNVFSSQRKSIFRCGKLCVCPYLMEAVSRWALVAAIRAHFSGQAVDLGEYLLSVHAYAGKSFVVVTVPAEDATHIRWER